MGARDSTATPPAAEKAAITTTDTTADQAEVQAGSSSTGAAEAPKEAGKCADNKPAASLAETEAQGEPPTKDAGAGSATTALAVGSTVEICGTPMSGSVGVVQEYLEDKGRWRVLFDSGTAKNFKEESLKVVKLKKHAKARKKEADSGYTRIADPVASTTGAATGGAGRRTAMGMGSLSDALQLMKGKAEVSETVQAPEPMQTSEPEVQDNPFAGLQLGAPRQKRRMEDGGQGSAKRRRQDSLAISEPGTEQTGSSEAVALSPPQINVAGRSFQDRKALTEHFQKMKSRLDSDLKDGEHLGAEDMFFIFYLALHFPSTAAKVTSPVKGIRYGTCAQFPTTKCFILVFDGGDEMPISITRCIKELCEKAEKSQQEAVTYRAQQEPIKEATRQEVGLRLVGDLAKLDGAAWEYPLMDEDRRCFVGYLRPKFSEELLTSFFERVKEGTKWDQPKDPRSGEPIPRKTSWMVSGKCSCTYRYGGVDVEPQQFPDWMRDIMKACMPLCGLEDEAKWPNSCNLNLYEGGSMSVGWHADDEKLFQGRYKDCLIISLSLGETRAFELRENDVGDEPEERSRVRLKLNSGDLCTMEGLTQKHYQHRVPKEKLSGARINLTWRWVKKHRPDCALFGVSAGNKPVAAADA
eukprot:TRINITY_DN60261_c0_g1_i1.p1 TRINITY_DN60261_c0_g1~~TRINITY_DN60261_c0_g1_i1.p1  ORF type:complete len:638 (-),score=124.24 TRINITY_DN60261_c0_g1_i1:39-1952(-)